MTTLNRIIDWLADNLPAQCDRCGRWARWKHLRKVRHRVYGNVNICEVCFRELYGGGGDG